MNPALRLLAVAASAGFVDPTSISGLQLWLDSDDATTFTYSSSTIVSQWADKSGNSRHMGQGTVSKQPNRNGTQNGKSTVVFDGSDDYLDRTSGVTIGLTNLTVFVVGKETVENNNSGFLVLMDSSTNDYDNTASIIFTTSSNARYFDIYCNGGTAYVGTSGVTPIGAYCGRKSGTTLDAYRDGTAGTGGTITATGTANARWLIGNRYYGGAYQSGAGNGPLQGHIAEVIVYDSALSTTDRNAVEAYLKAKWGTP